MADRLKNASGPDTQVTAPNTLSNAFLTENCPSYQVSWTLVRKFAFRFSARQCPLTAPTSGSASKMGTACSSASGSQTVSLSAKAMTVPSDSSSPAASAPFLPRFSVSSMSLIGYFLLSRRSTLAVLSVDASSTTMISVFRYVWLTMDAMHWPTSCSSLWTATMQLTSGSAAPYPRSTPSAASRARATAAGSRYRAKDTIIVMKMTAVTEMP